MIKLNDEWGVDGVWNKSFNALTHLFCIGAEGWGYVLSVYGIINRPPYVINCVSCQKAVPEEVLNKLKFIYHDQIK